MEPPPPPPRRQPGRGSTLAGLGVLVLALVVVRSLAPSVLPSIATAGDIVRLVWEGDSQSAPIPGRTTTANAAARALEEEVVVQTTATGGALFSTLEERAAEIDALRLSDPGVRNVLVVWAGTNDLGEGDSPAVVHRRMLRYTADRRAAGWTVVVLTALPRHYLGDDPGYEARRLAFNELVRGTWTEMADLLVDVGADPVVGAPEANLDSEHYGLDQIHLNSAGRERVGRLVAEAMPAIGVR